MARRQPSFLDDYGHDIPMRASVPTAQEERARADAQLRDRAEQLIGRLRPAVPRMQAVDVPRGRLWDQAIRSGTGDFTNRQWDQHGVPLIEIAQQNVERRERLEREEQERIEHELDPIRIAQENEEGRERLEREEEERVRQRVAELRIPGEHFPIHPEPVVFNLMFLIAMALVSYFGHHMAFWLPRHHRDGDPILTIDPVPQVQPVCLPRQTIGAVEPFTSVFVTNSRWFGLAIVAYMGTRRAARALMAGASVLRRMPARSLYTAVSGLVLVALVVLMDIFGGEDDAPSVDLGL